MIKTLLMLFIGLIIVSPVYALDLSNYPDPFIKKGVFDAILVVGDNAKADDVVGITDVAMSMQAESKVSKTIYRAGCGEYVVNDLIRIDVGAVQLASKAFPQFKEQNMIIVGGPCANPIAASLLGHPDDCTSGFEYGKATIRLFEHEKGKYSLLVAGLLGDDTRAGAQVLSNYQDYNFKGNQIIVADTSKSRPSIKMIN